MLLFQLPDNYLAAMAAWLLAGLVSLVSLLKLRRRYRRGGRSQALPAAGLSLWMLLAVVTGFELYFALFRDTTDAFNQTNVSRRWFRLHADAEARTLQFSDGQGLRYREAFEVTREVPPGRRRTIFLGDSFTFGHGIADIRLRFTNRVAEALDHLEPGRHQVANLAWAGTELHWVNEVAHRLIADEFDMRVLLYVLCLNDIESFSDKPSEYADLGSSAPQSRLFSETYFLNTLYYRFRQLRTPRLRNYYGSIGDLYAGAPWQRMQVLLDDTRDTCDQAGVQFAIVVFPFLHHLEEGTEFDTAHAAIARYSKQSGVPLLDLRETLRRHDREKLTLNALDAHPNARAHAIAAEAITPFLLDLHHAKEDAGANADAGESPASAGDR